MSIPPIHSFPIAEPPITEPENIIEFLTKASSLQLLNRPIFPLSKQTSIELINDLIDLVWGSPQYLSHLKIKDKEFLYKTVKKLAERRNVSEYVHEYGITNEDHRFQIATMAAMEMGKSLSQFIKNYGITNEDRLYAIAEKCCWAWSGSLCENLKNFGITDQNLLYNLAKQCASRDGLATSEFIKNFGITDQEKRFEIAKTCVFIDDLIKNYELSNDQMFEIAKRQAFIKPDSFCNHFQNYEISDPERLYEIGKILAAEGAGELFAFTQKCNFNQNQTATLLKIYAEKRPLRLIGRIKEFGIQNQDVLFELAKICLKNSTGEHFRNFDIKDPLKRYELAKIAAKDRAASASIDKFDIFDQEQLFEIAMITAQSQDNYVAEHIEKYNLKSEEHLFKIAKECVQSSKTMRYFNRFGIKNEDYLFEIALIAAEKNANELRENLEYFNFTNHDRYHQLAEIMAPQKTSFISYSIEKFKIKDYSFLLEIAKKAMKANPAHTAKYICNYNFTNQDDLFLLAKMFAENNGEEASRYIENFNIQDPTRRFEIAKIVINQNPWTSVGFIQYYKIEKPELLHDLAVHIVALIGAHCNNYGFPGTIERIFKQIDEKFVQISSIVPPVINTQLRDLIKPEKLSEKAKSWTNINLSGKSFILQQVLVFLCGYHSNQSYFINCLQHHPNLLLAIFDERDASLWWPLLGYFLLISELDKGPIASNALQQMTLLPFMHMDVDEKENIKSKILKCDLRNTQLRTPLIKTIIALKETKALPVTRKNILNWILENPKNKDQVIKRALSVQAIIDLNGDLNKFTSTPPDIVLTERLKEILPDLNLSEQRLQSTFLQMRNPFSIFTYLGRLATLPKKEREGPLEYLTRVMNSVFANNFREVRQNTQKNEHLHFLNEKHPAILKQFYECRTKEICLNQNNEKQEKYTILHKMIKNSLNDGHLKDTDLIKFEKNHIPDAEQNFARLREATHNITQLESDIRKISKEKGECHKKDHAKFVQLDAYVVYLKMQLFAMRLMNKDFTEAHFNEFCTFFTHALKKDCEFLNDIQAMCAVFQNKKINEKYTLYDTDDPYEILLCGTEVEGSCQRLNGDPRKNRGLLGYLLNGQTRLLIIKEDETILGRAIIRLLINSRDEPVLFMERIYPQSLDTKLADTLQDFAKEKAKMLNIPLLRKEGKNAYETTIKNIDVQAEEYVDAAGGICELYEIHAFIH